MEKRKLSAKEILTDLRAGMDDHALMEKYQLADHNLRKVFEKLIAAGFLSRSEVESRSSKKNAPIPWGCPSCGRMHEERFETCPACGIIAAKFDDKQRQESTKARDTKNEKRYLGAFLNYRDYRFRLLALVCVTLVIIALSLFYHKKSEDSPVQEISNEKDGNFDGNSSRKPTGRLPIKLTQCIYQDGLMWDALICLRQELDEGADINKRYEHGNTALMVAVLMGKKEVVRFLVERGASVNAKDYKGSTALHLACMREYPTLEVVNLLLEAGADPNAQTKNDEYGYGGTTPLMLACGASRSGAEEVVNSLINSGANFEMQTSDGATAAYFAASSAAPKILSLLIERAANVDHKQKNGRTLLFEAASCNDRDDDVRTLSRNETLRILLEQGLDPNAVDANGDTPLMIAVSRSCFSTAEFLLEKGANVAARNKKGWTVLFWAQGKKDSKMTELLTRYGAKE